MAEWPFDCLVHAPTATPGQGAEDFQTPWSRRPAAQSPAEMKGWTIRPLSLLQNRGLHSSARHNGQTSKRLRDNKQGFSRTPEGEKRIRLEELGRRGGAVQRNRSSSTNCSHCF